MDEKRLLFSMKTRQVNVKTNYRNGFSNLLCRLCEKPGEVESEIHLMSCEKILMESDIKEKLEKIAFSDIFGPIEKQISAIKVWKKVIKI